MINKNKKAYSISGWTEVALLGILVVLMIGVVIVNMNSLYNQNYDGTFGLATNSTLKSLSDYQDTLQSATREGEAQTSAITGISLSSTWSMVKTGLNIMWDFLTGGWIERAVSLTRIPTIVGTIFRILFVLSIGYIAIKLLLKVRP